MLVIARARSGGPITVRNFLDIIKNPHFVKQPPEQMVLVSHKRGLGITTQEPEMLLPPSLCTAEPTRHLRVPVCEMPMRLIDLKAALKASFPGAEETRLFMEMLDDALIVTRRD